MSALGDDGAELAIKSGRDEAIMIARYADEIARLPDSQRVGIVMILIQDMKRMVAFMGRFAENNPGKVLFTASATGIILANSERVLGGSEILLDGNGNLVLIEKPGLIERGIMRPAADAVTEPISSGLRSLFAVISFFAAGWFGVKLLFFYFRQRARHSIYKAKRSVIQSPTSDEGRDNAEHFDPG